MSFSGVVLKSTCPSCGHETLTAAAIDNETGKHWMREPVVECSNTECDEILVLMKLDPDE